jgi:hypothetical protein
VSGKAHGSAQIGIALLAEIARSTRDGRVYRHTLPTLNNPGKFVTKDKGLFKPSIPYGCF